MTSPKITGSFEKFGETLVQAAGSPETCSLVASEYPLAKSECFGDTRGALNFLFASSDAKPLYVEESSME